LICHHLGNQVYGIKRGAGGKYNVTEELLGKQMMRYMEGDLPNWRSSLQICVGVVARSSKILW